MLRMSSHDFFCGGGTETKWSSCTVISFIYCAVRAPSSSVKSSGTTANSIESFFPVLEFVTFKRVIPRGFIPVPFHIFRVLFDGVTWLLVVWHLVFSDDVYRSSAVDLQFNFLVIDHHLCVYFSCIAGCLFNCMGRRTKNVCRWHQPYVIC